MHTKDTPMAHHTFRPRKSESGSNRGNRDRDRNRDRNQNRRPHRMDHEDLENLPEVGYAHLDEMPPAALAKEA